MINSKLFYYNDPVIDASPNLQAYQITLSEWYTKCQTKLNHNKSVHMAYTQKRGFCANVIINNLHSFMLFIGIYFGIYLYPFSQYC